MVVHAEEEVGARESQVTEEGIVEIGVDIHPIAHIAA
jgi:hypothetical protein